MLFLLTLVGLIVRFWKIGNGLPHIFFMDEGHYVFWALNMGGGDLNPHQFTHPNLFFYLNFFVDVAYVLFGLAAGLFKAPSDAWQLYKTDPTVYYVIGRSISAFLGAMTIPIVFHAGSKLFSRTIGWLAALLMCFTYLHVLYSQIGYIDATLTFFMTFSFLLAIQALKTQKMFYYVLSGLVGGLSASTKYNGLAAFMWGPLALWVGTLENKQNPLSSLFSRKMLWFGLCFLIGFSLGTPYWILSGYEFKMELMAVWRDYKAGGTGQLGYEGKWNWLYYLVQPLRYGLGYPLETLGIMGLLFILIRCGWLGLFFAAFPILYIWVSGMSDIRCPRYMLPVIPFFCLSASYLIQSLVSVVQLKRKRLGSVVLIVFASVLLLPNLAKVIRYNHLKSAPDTRELSNEWISKNIPQGVKLLKGFYAFPPDIPGRFESTHLDLSVFDTRLKHVSALKTLEEYRSQGYQYLVLDDWHLGIIEAGARANPKYRSTVERYRLFKESLDHSATLLVSFDPYLHKDTPFDPENIEFMSTGQWRVRSTGPRIWIYQL